MGSWTAARLVGVVLFGGLFGWAGVARADSGDGGWEGGGEGDGGAASGIHFGLRLAFALPMGDLHGSWKRTSTLGGVTQTTTVERAELSEGVTGQIPIWVDLGWQISPRFMAGLYFSYGVLLPTGDLSDACDAESCTANDIRLGAQAQYAFSPGRSLDPWLGAGLGYEWFSVKVGEVTSRYRGAELLMLQAGLDLGGDSGSTTYGPFAAFTFGRFSTIYSKIGDSGESRDIDSPATHHWLFLGVRGVVK